jgi:hypothetical protein
MIQSLLWAAGYNIVAIPLAAGVLAPVGFLPSPAVGALLIPLITVKVAINVRLLRGSRSGCRRALELSVRGCRNDYLWRWGQRGFTGPILLSARTT